jgi:hypothetical protein
MPPYAKMDGLMPFLQALTMPPIQQNGWLIPFLHATTMPPIRQNGHDQSEHRYLHALILQNAWTYAILAGVDHATHTQKWMA